MWSKLKLFSISRKSWLLLALVCLGLEVSAIYFQYGMNLSPCVMCIYERVAILGILITGILGAMAPKCRYWRVICLILWLAISIKGLMLGLEHVDYQKNPFLLQCGLSAKFPAFLPLDQIFPAFFRPYGLCSDVVWSFLNLSMAEWIVVIFCINVVLSGVFLISQIAKTKYK